MYTSLLVKKNFSSNMISSKIFVGMLLYLHGCFASPTICDVFLATKMIVLSTNSHFCDDARQPSSLCGDKYSVSTLYSKQIMLKVDSNALWSKWVEAGVDYWSADEWAACYNSGNWWGQLRSGASNSELWWWRICIGTMMAERNVTQQYHVVKLRDAMD